MQGYSSKQNPFLYKPQDYNPSIRMQFNNGKAKQRGNPPPPPPGFQRPNQNSLQSSLVTMSTPSFVIGNLIGKGGFGQVYQAMDQNTGQLIAIKRVYIYHIKNDKQKIAQQIMQLKNQIQNLRSLQYQHIVQYKGFEVNKQNNSVEIIMEYVPRSLKYLINHFGGVSEQLAKNYGHQILKGLNYLHMKNIVHRDLKCANILIDNDGTCKLSDFGASLKLQSDDVSNELTGSPYWMAPQIINKSGHSFPADIWSFGCVIIQLLTGVPPWSQFKMDVRSLLIKIASEGGPPPYPDNISTSCRSLLDLCFIRRQSDRATVRQLLEHDFMKGKIDLLQQQIQIIDAQKIREQSYFEMRSTSSTGLLEMIQAKTPPILRISSGGRPRPVGQQFENYLLSNDIIHQLPDQHNEQENATYKVPTKRLPSHSFDLLNKPLSKQQKQKILMKSALTNEMNKNSNLIDEIMTTQEYEIRVNNRGSQATQITQSRAQIASHNSGYPVQLSQSNHPGVESQFIQNQNNQQYHSNNQIQQQNIDYEQGGNNANQLFQWPSDSIDQSTLWPSHLPVTGGAVTAAQSIMPQKSNPQNQVISTKIAQQMRLKQQQKQEQKRLRNKMMQKMYEQQLKDLLQERKKIRKDNSQKDIQKSQSKSLTPDQSICSLPIRFKEQIFN